MSRLSAALMVIVWLSSAQAAGADEGSLEAVHARASEHAARGECAEALEHYRALERSGVVDADVAYDRALCHAEVDELGAAIVWLERARRIAPRDQEIRDALSRAESRLAAARERENHGEPLTEGASLFGALTAGMHASTLQVSALVFQVLAFASLGLLLITRRERLRVALGLVSSFSFAFCLTAVVGVATRLEWFEEGTSAIVVASEATLRTGPDERAPGRRVVREGDRLRILGARRDYAEVRLPDKQRGFIRTGEVVAVWPHGTD